jgi:uncharacterized protein (UPF0332 family)
MGKLALEFQKCAADGKISAFSDGPSLVAKQLGIAASDLGEATGGLSRNRWKWSTIQAYYSMFHTARALLFAKGFREKHHRCLRIAVAHLYDAEGESFHRLIDDFRLAKQLRENADYAEDFSENSARKLVASAEQFLSTARAILERPVKL